MPTKMIQTRFDFDQKWAFPSLEILRSIWNMHLAVLALIRMKAFLGALPGVWECFGGIMRILLQGYNYQTKQKYGAIKFGINYSSIPLFKWESLFVKKKTMILLTHIFIAKSVQSSEASLLSFSLPIMQL
jgi:hypothetical protein